MTETRVGYDHTNLAHRHKRIWRFPPWELPGLGLWAAIVGVCAAALTAGIPVWVTLSTGQSAPAVWGIFLGIPVGVAVYVGWDRGRVHGFNIGQLLLVNAHYLLQPRVIADFRPNTEPDRVSVEVILWRPK